MSKEVKTEWITVAAGDSQTCDEPPNDFRRRVSFVYSTG